MPREQFRLGIYYLSQRQGSPNWYRTWRERGAKHRESLGVSDFETAKVRLEQWYILNAEMRGARAQDVPLAVVLDRYLAAKTGLYSYKSARIAAERWKAAGPGMSASEVSVPWQERFIDAMREEGLTDSYIKRVLGVGKAALNRAWRRGEVVGVPFVELPADSEPFPHYLSLDEQARLLGVIRSPHLWLYVLIRMNTGCRGDAALDLRPEQVDFKAGVVKLNPAGRTQTKKRRPVVPLTQTLRRVLAPHTGPGPYVHWHGQPVRSVKRAWAIARVAAGLPDAYAPRVLRHTFATELRRRGVTGWDTAGFMGHSDESHKTTGRYAKADPAYLGKARKAIDDWMVELGRKVPALRSLGANSGPSIPSGNAKNPL